MGFPVFNLVAGLFAGYYSGNRICSEKIRPERRSKLINQVSLFTGLIMILICITSGVIGMTDKTIGENIRGMLGIDFEVSRTLILIIILTGGLGLIVSQYFITRLAMVKTIRLNK
jgi:uncharacterized protein YneF (UPF0154 family)